MIENITCAVTQVATVTADAVSAFSDELLFDTQSPDSELRFKKYFPGFPSEKLIAGMWF